MINNKLFGAILLISGTSVGAGMLALPVITAEYGFISSSILFVICWAFMTYAALLMLEANLWLSSHSNMISMADATLGKTGKGIAWATYLLLLYSLLAAYLTGMNAILSQTSYNIVKTQINPWLSSLMLITLFGLIIYSGARAIDYLNRLLIIGLVLSFILLVLLLSPHVNSNQLIPTHFHRIYLAVPIAITSFGYQIIIPSLRDYLHNDIKQLRKAILIGSLIPLVTYLVWEAIIIGVIPYHGEHGLQAILAGQQPAIGLTQALSNLVGNTTVALLSKTFVTFAISTSFIGVSFSLFDFLADGLQIKQHRLGRLSTALITFIPPVLFALLYPNGFVVALGYAGIFVAILLCLLPAIMVWNGRYRIRLASGYQAAGGKTAIIILILIAAAIITTEIINKS